MLIRVRLLKKWGEYGMGSVVDLGESKARTLIAAGVAIAANSNEQLVHVRTGNDVIRLKLLKKWGEYAEGTVIDFGERKGRPLIEKKIAVEVSKREKKIVIKPEKKKKPKAETAMVEPIAETAEVTPKITTRRGRPRNKKE